MMRKEKKMTANQAIAKVNSLMVENAMLKQELEQTERRLLMQIDYAHKMFVAIMLEEQELQLENPTSGLRVINNMREFYQKFRKEMDDICESDADNKDELILQKLENYGFTFEKKVIE